MLDSKLSQTQITASVAKDALVYQSLKRLPILSILLLITCRIISFWHFPLFDDAFITYRYAENLSHGAGLVYNLSEWVLGTTSPLYAVVLAAIDMLGIRPERAALVLGILLDVVTGVITFQIIARSFSYRAGVLFLIAFAISPVLNRIAVGGMEANLFVLLVVVTVWLLARGNAIAGTVLGSAAYFVRPEAVVILAVYGIEQIVRGRIGKAALLGLLSLAVALPVLAVLFYYYGAIVPQSLAAKSVAIGSSYWSVVQTLLAPEPIAAATLALAAPGLRPCLAHGAFPRLLVLSMTLYLVAYLLAQPKMWTWYGAPTLYTLAFAAAVGGDQLIRRRRLFDHRLGAHRLQLLALPMAAAVLFLVREALDDGDVQRNIYRALSDHCRRQVPRESSVLAGDIGAVGYYCNNRVLDSAALVWPEALRYETMHEMITAERPDYLFLNTTTETRSLMQQEGLRGSYRPVARFSKSGTQETDPGKVSWSDTWVQDYLLYQADPPKHPEWGS